MLQNLSEIVVEEGLATAEQMKKAARQADELGKPLIAALVDESDVDQLALVTALGKHTKVDVRDSDGVEVDIEAVRQMSQEICGRLKVMPISMTAPGEDQTLELAVADSTDAVGLAEVEHVCGCRVKPVLMTLDEVEKLIHRYYRELVTEVMPRKRTGFGGDDSKKGPTTEPHHRIADEAGLAIRIEALIKLLQDKGVIKEEELEDAVRELLQEHSNAS